jgi:hypothetical protein
MRPSIGSLAAKARQIGWLLRDAVLGEDLGWAHGNQSHHDRGGRPTAAIDSAFGGNDRWYSV